MQITPLPTRFGVPFANGAGSNYIRPIPVPSQISIQSGAASMTDGFPPVTFLPVAAGGTPPFGQDFNGLLNQITAWLRVLTTGMVIPHDAAFQSAIGGYPRGALVGDPSVQNLVWQSQTDNNTTNPGTGAGWSTPIYVDPSTGGLTINAGAGNVNGANLKLIGTGAAPTKYIRAQGGEFHVLNNAYNTILMTLQENGNCTVSGALRAGVGAYGSADPSVATVLADYTLASTSDGYMRFPNGFMVTWQRILIPHDNNVYTFTYPTGFPKTPLQTVGVYETGNPPTGTLGFNAISQTQFYAQNMMPSPPSTTNGVRVIAIGY